MAARRGKTQAKRNSGGDSGLPGWAWMVLGILLAVVVILVAPKYLKSGGDGFFRPQPNPDAEPARVSGSDDEAIADEGTPAPTKGKAGDAKQAKDTDYDFYTLLPGKEVPMSDAELAASEQAEAKRQAARSKPEPAAVEPDAPASTPTPATPSTAALPRPVETDTVPSRAPQNAPATPPTTVASATPAPSESKPAAVEDGTRYLLQAGAFQASGQAEEMKARIAMLGLSARVESAAINGNTVYRVRMGPYGTASDLADAKRKLASGGLPAMAIKVK